MKELRPYQIQAVNECWEALKKNNEPVLLMASVGAGKSLMLADILITMQKAGKKALCLVNNSELVRNNCETLKNQGGNASIYCAALGAKDISSSIIFGSPQSIINGINKDEPISHIPFNIIIVDEAHTINYLNNSNCFMRIIRHYKHLYPDMRLLGATGTNFRFKGTPIVGEDALFKTQVGNITTEWLIEQGYLIKPRFEIDDNLVLDFSKVRIKQNGKFDYKQLELVIDKSARLTELICKQVIHIMESQQRRGVIFFATTKKHAYEIMGHLPPNESAIILGGTPEDEREKIINKSRNGAIRYLVNISIISVGVDIPAFDTVAYLRPTESLVLVVQTMGRVLRLSPSTGKTEALVLDFAGNIERHQDWDNPILLAALAQTIDKDKPLVIRCPACEEMNTEHARRCIGKLTKKGSEVDKTEYKRCQYYFEFKACPSKECEAKNDIAARHCWKCNTEIIDPNKKLSLKSIQKQAIEVNVLQAEYSISGTYRGFRINCAYKCQSQSGKIGIIFEHYSPVSDKSTRMFYGQFVKKHLKDASKWYTHLYNRSKVEEMLNKADTPIKLIICYSDKGTKIKEKIFNN